jgi:hypothetical protein
MLALPAASALNLSKPARLKMFEPSTTLTPTFRGPAGNMAAAEQGPGMSAPGAVTMPSTSSENRKRVPTRSTVVNRSLSRARAARDAAKIRS